MCVIKQVNSMMYEFFWNGKTNKVKRNFFEQEFKNGGYKMINFTDIITASSIVWVQKYSDNAEREWKYTLEYFSEKRTKIVLFLKGVILMLMNYQLCAKLLYECN